MTTVRSTRRQRQTEASRRDILDAATRLVSYRGMSAVTMRDVAIEAGISSGSIFFHFGNREGLFREVAKDLRRRALATTDPILQSPTLAPAEKIARFIDALIDWPRSNPDFIRVPTLLTMETIDMPSVKELQQGWTRTSRKPIIELMEQAISSGAIRPVEIDSFLDFLYAGLQGAVIQSAAYGQRRSIEPLLAMVRRACHEMLGLDPA